MTHLTGAREFRCCYEILQTRGKFERFQNTPSLRSVSAKMPWSVVRSLALNDWVRVKRYRGPRSRSGRLSVCGRATAVRSPTVGH